MPESDGHVWRLAYEGEVRTLGDPEGVYRPTLV